MSKGIVGTIILCILVMVGFFVQPIIYMGYIDQARAQNQLLDEVQFFLDKVADTKTITDNDLADFTLAMAGTSIPVEFEIIREARQVNPDPASTEVPKKTYTSWVPVENNRSYDEGDIIIIKVRQIGKSYSQSFSEKAMGMFTPSVNFDLARMVR